MALRGRPRPSKPGSPRRKDAKPSGKPAAKTHAKSPAKSFGKTGGRPRGKPSGDGATRPAGGPARPAGGAGKTFGAAKRKPGPGKFRPRGGKRPKRGAPRPEPNEFGPQRLQKVLAAAGLGSRRECESLITTSRVQVDGAVVTELGTKVDPHEQQIRVDGEVLAKARRVYFLVHKPPGVLSTNRDPAGRMRVIDLVPPGPERVYAVGRLDQSSEGLIIVTNDGALANLVTHPRYGIDKTYQVLVAGTPSPEALERLLGGIHLSEGIAKADRLEVKTQHAHSTQLEMVLSEGRNREIRRLLARVGHKVLRLRRTAVGRLKLRDLKPGECRRLTSDEIEQLRSAAKEGVAAPPPPRPRRPARAGGPRKYSPARRGATAGGKLGQGSKRPFRPRAKPAGPAAAKPAGRPRVRGGGVIADDA